MCGRRGIIYSFRRESSSCSQHTKNDALFMILFKGLFKIMRGVARLLSLGCFLFVFEKLTSSLLTHVWSDKRVEEHDCSRYRFQKLHLIVEGDLK